MRAFLLSALWIHLFLSPLIFSVRLPHHFELPKVLLLVLSALAVLVCWVCGSRPKFRRPLLSLGCSLLVVSWIVSTFYATELHTAIYGDDGSFHGLAVFLAYLVVFWGTIQAFESDAGQVRFLLSAPILALAVSVAYGYAQFLGWDPIPWTAHQDSALPFRQTSGLGHPILQGAFLCAALPLLCESVRFAAKNELVTWTRAGGILIFLTAFSIVLTGSRGAWLGLAVTLLLYGWLSADWKEFKPLAKRAVPVVLTLVVLAILSPAGRKTVDITMDRARLGWSQWEVRAGYWQIALEVFREHPLVGAGLDCYGAEFERRRTKKHWSNEWGRTAQRAHNVVLQVLCCQGLLGMLAYGLCGFALAARLAKQKMNSLQRAAVAGLGGLLVQWMLSFLTAGVTTLAITYLALIFAKDGGETDWRPTRYFAAGTVFLGSGAFLIVFWSNLRRVEYGLGVRLIVVLGLLLAISTLWAYILKCCQGLEGPRPLPLVGGAVLTLALGALLLGPTLKGYLLQGQGEYHRASELQPNRFVLKLESARVLMDVARQSHSERASVYRMAEAQTYQAVALAPNRARPYWSLGALQAQMERSGVSPKEPPLQALEKAVEIEPQNPNLLFDLARISRLLGQENRVPLSRVEEMYPGWGPVLAERALERTEAGDLGEAETLMQECYSTRWRTRETLKKSYFTAFAQAYEKAGKSDESAMWTDRVRRVRP
jgi:O-antigen ligase